MKEPREPLTFQSKFTLRQKRDFADYMRNNPTRAEDALWKELRFSRLGFYFQRQALVRGYILDFYCAVARLGIEVDGSIHDLQYIAEADATKESRLTAGGIRLIRFENEDVLNWMPVVLARIKQELTSDAALKAFASKGSGRSKEKDITRRRSMVYANSAKPPGVLYPVEVSPNLDCEQLTTAAVDSCGNRPISVEEAAEIDRKFRHLVNKFTLTREFDNRPMSERAQEQRLRLSEYLREKTA